MSALFNSTRCATTTRRCDLTRTPVSELNGKLSLRPSRTVDLSALHDFDQARLRALLFRSREHTKHDWLEATGAFAEVRIVDSDDTDAVGTQGGRTQITIQISEAGDMMRRPHAHHPLARPLLLGGLVEVLLRLEAIFSNREDSSAIHETPSTFQSRTQGPVDYTVSPAYRLRKWPPEKMLQRQPLQDQIAKVFTAQPLTIAQASRMSRARYAQCWAFIRECMVAGIVEVHQPVCTQQLRTPTNHRDSKNRSTAGSTPSIRLFARLVAYFG